MIRSTTKHVDVHGAVATVPNGCSRNMQTPRNTTAGTPSRNWSTAGTAMQRMPPIRRMHGTDDRITGPPQCCSRNVFVRFDIQLTVTTMRDLSFSSLQNDLLLSDYMPPIVAHSFMHVQGSQFPEDCVFGIILPDRHCRCRGKQVEQPISSALGRRSNGLFSWSRQVGTKALHAELVVVQAGKPSNTSLLQSQRLGSEIRFGKGSSSCA